MNYIQGAVAVEGRHLDGHNLFNASKGFPECGRQDHAAHCGLKIKAHQRYHQRYSATVSQYLGFAGAAKRRQTE